MTLDLDITLDSATLQTANGNGLLDIIGNINVTEAMYINGDSYVKGNSEVNGTLHVDGTSLLNGDVTIANQLTVPTINVTHLYQPSNWANPDINITIQGSADSGTIFFIDHGTTINLPTSSISEGINYQAIITGTNSSPNNTLTFATIDDGRIYYRILGTGTQNGTFENIYLNTYTELGTEGLAEYVFNTSWSIPVLTSTTMRTGNTTGSISFNLINMRLGDKFDIIYVGNNNWVINGYINDISTFY
jgi:hypothetical protein